MKAISLAALAATIVFPCSAAAQDQPVDNHIDDEPHLGVGAALQIGTIVSPQDAGVASISTGPFGGGAVLVPMDLFGYVRLEPEIGFMYASTTQDDLNATTDASVSTVKPALGIFWIFALGDSAQGSLGARVGPQFVMADRTSTDKMTNTTTSLDTSRIDVAVGPTLGGEYFFSKHFSLGAEVRVDLIFIGDTDDGGSLDTSGFAAATTAAFAARAFFF